MRGKRLDDRTIARSAEIRLLASAGSRMSAPGGNSRVDRVVDGEGAGPSRDRHREDQHPVLRGPGVAPDRRHLVGDGRDGLPVHCGLERSHHPSRLVRVDEDQRQLPPVPERLVLELEAHLRQPARGVVDDDAA